MNTVTITRKSNVGFGYTSAVENDERGNLRVCEVFAPTHTGTILSVEKKISDDSALASYRGGTYYRWAWFVKIDGQWRKIKATDENNWEMGRLTEKCPDMHGDVRYEADAVTVEIEE